MVTKAIIISGFILADVATGLISAFANGNYNSSKMRLGLFHKIAEILAVAFGAFCDYAFPYIDMTLPFSLFNATMGYIVLMELGSIIENFGQIFPELGEILSKTFEKVGRK